VQIQAFYLFVAISIAVAAVFVWVALSTRLQREPSSKFVIHLQRWFVVILATSLIVAFVGAILRKPYPNGDERPERVVYAVGMQFSWGLSNQPITNADEWQEATYAPPLRIPTGSLVEFRVTSFDVIHSFGVFSPSGHLLGEVQAMPGYVNDLFLRFTQPGTYWVFCLELCGMGHHRMRGEFVVVPQPADGARGKAHEGF
jgi:cytochrome c oxidase subunit II